MLSESFLQTLPYRDETRLSSTTTTPERQGGEHRHTLRGDTLHRPALRLTEAEELCHTPRSLRTDLDPSEGRGPWFAFPSEVGFLTTDFASTHVHYPPHPDEHQSACSLIRQYPDLRLRQDEATSPHSGGGSCHSLSASVSRRPLQAPPRRTASSSGPDRPPSIGLPEQTYPVKPGTSNSDHGYLEMNNGHRDLELSLPGLEPLSNSLLNGLLERHMDELYRQHFTDSLARCNSQLGHSLLRGLVPLPETGPGLAQASDFMEASLQGTASRDGGELKCSNLNATSHFSSPMLRISEAGSPPRPPPRTTTHT